MASSQRPRTLSTTIGEQRQDLSLIVYETFEKLSLHYTVLIFRDSSHVLWSNGNPRVSHISSLVTCNSHASANLMVGSDDGCVRVWSMEPDASCGTESASDSAPRGSQVTGWLVMPELVPQSLSSGSRVSCGLQMAWDQHSLTLMAGGDHKVRRANISWSVPNPLNIYLESSYLGLFQ